MAYGFGPFGFQVQDAGSRAGWRVGGFGAWGSGVRALMGLEFRFQV